MSTEKYFIFNGLISKSQIESFFGGSYRGESYSETFNQKLIVSVLEKQSSRPGSFQSEHMDLWEKKKETSI